MKNLKYFGLTLALVTSFTGCEQETLELKKPEVVQTPACPDDASAGSASFTKYVAIGNSITAGFQAGALFDEGQETSLGNLLATQFACVGGGEFNQPDINSEFGFYLGGGNPTANNVILGRLLLQGTPPAPSPTVSNLAALPNPALNPGFLYGGDRTKLNNFGVPGITLIHAVNAATGNWGNTAHPLFNPFYARFASDGGQGTTTLLNDAVTALANNGTFFSFWLGNNDVLGYALTGGANPAILTPMEPNPDTGHPGFPTLYAMEINALLAVPNVKGVVGNIPAVTTIPYFRLVTYNAIPLDQTTAGALNNGFAGLNQILNALKGNPFNLPAAEMDSRKITFAAGQNAIVIDDEKARDLGPYFDQLQGAGMISAEDRARLAPYENARQATATDLITLSAGAILGKTVGGNPQLINGLTVPLGDQYVLIPSEITEINERVADFNEVIANVVEASNGRIALADVHARYNQLLAAGFEVVDGVSVSPSLAPPLGLFSEDGIHPNSRGVAVMANVFIDAINAKFGAKVPKVNVAKYMSTGLPINP